MDRLINVLANPVNVILILLDSFFALITIAEFTSISLRIITALVGLVIAYFTIKRIKMDLEVLKIKKEKEVMEVELLKKKLDSHDSSIS